MMTHRTLVVYYSRTGNTRKVAETISKMLLCEVEEVKDLKDRNGPIGWLTSGRDAGKKSLTKIQEPLKDPAHYDLVIIGTPVWNNTVSTPIRTYITNYSKSFNNVAIFVTGDAEKSDAIQDAESILSKKPIEFIQLNRKRDIESGKSEPIIEQFVAQIKAYLSETPKFENLDMVEQEEKVYEL